MPSTGIPWEIKATILNMMNIVGHLESWECTCSIDSNTTRGHNAAKLGHFVQAEGVYAFNDCFF